VSVAYVPRGHAAFVADIAGNRARATRISFDTLQRPYRTANQTALQFGLRSHWAQPWRGWLETLPATRLLDAVGINFNVNADEADATARLLGTSGFRRARVEIGWSSLSYEDPRRFTNFPDIQRKLVALRDNGLRPLILLNANQGVPCPTRFFDARITAPARTGDREVHLDPATAAAVVPGRTGLNALDGSYKAADVLFTSVARDGLATLSKPLSRDLAPGSYHAATLRYAPFGPPVLPNGSPNPAFEETLRGWLDYVDVVTHTVQQIVGDNDFDVEIWNELSFGSDFLSGDTYYDPPREQATGKVDAALLARTVAWLRDSAHGLNGIGIGDGFASERPWDSAANTPPGLTAIDKHPYTRMVRFPSNAQFNGLTPLNALGRRDGVERGRGQWADRFLPRYDAFFPEYWLSGIQTETMARDLSPITTDVYGTPHGRASGPGGSQVWITEFNMSPREADPGLTPEAAERIQTKLALRTLVAYANKGVTAIDFFAAKDPVLGLVSQRFYDAVEAGSGAYPGPDPAGSTPQGIRRLVAGFSGARPISRPRRLSLRTIQDFEGRIQFQGDGTRAHPPLYDRDVLGFFPFQVSASRFVVPIYVMTRNVAQLYRPADSTEDPGRYDMPAERFRLTVGGLRARTARVSATDPLTGTAVPVRVSSRRGKRLVIDFPATDSPRLLTIDDGGS
jgi:hypothetical protein